MRIVAVVVAWIITASVFAANPAAARVSIDVDLNTQSMRVTTGAGEEHVWPVSTARHGYMTPTGRYRPTRLEKMHYSRKYEMAPMPHSIFFRGGYAIHGTYETRALGRPASHGCIRLAPTHAARLFALVRAEGATITISGGPRSTVVAGEKTPAHAIAYAPVETRPRAPSAFRSLR